MAAYQQSPQDEGYSEAPLTVGAVSGKSVVPHWVYNMTAAERSGNSPSAGKMAGRDVNL